MEKIKKTQIILTISTLLILIIIILLVTFIFNKLISPATPGANINTNLQSTDNPGDPGFPDVPGNLPAGTTNNTNTQTDNPGDPGFPE